MSDPRLDVLGAISRQLRTGVLPPAARLEHPGALVLPPGAIQDPDALARQFSGELEALGGHAIRVRDARAAVDGVVSLLAERGATRLLSWDPEWLDCPGLPEALAAAGIAVEPCWLPSDPDERRRRLAALDPVPVGLTGALAGLADTGSLVLVSGPGRGRMASLLPPVHVALLRADRLYPTYAAFLSDHPAVADEGSNLVLVTGPSRTADIEMTLTRGVHGPGEVIVVVFDEG